MNDITHPKSPEQQNPVNDSHDRSVKCCHCRQAIEPEMITFLNEMTAHWKKLNDKLLEMPSNRFGITRVEPKLCIKCRDKWERWEIGKDVVAYKPRRARKAKPKPETQDMFGDELESKTDQQNRE